MQGSFLRILRTVHGWLGIIVLPWALSMGLTGLYMNHSGFVLSFFPQDEFSESRLDELKPPAPITRENARSLAKSIWPRQPVQKLWQEDYHGRPSFFAETSKGWVILSIPTGHHYVKTPYTRRTFTPKEGLVHSKIYWGNIFEDLHETGWLGGGLGTWLADLFCIALVLFGVSGSMMWSIPRIGRLIKGWAN
ncbi:MAG: PepSY domain-containing protein [Proteobacteria bacterium]|nr:PepSY domain-containing protein [Pseudomonadota bacterium]